jgi:hypothetical protein
MLQDNELKAICSVTELTRKLGLSRARFYQLLEMGVFPRPVYCTRTKRPFYPLDLQQKCIDVRKTGIGHDGKPVVFYASQQNKTGKFRNPPYDKYKELAGILSRMGLNVTSGNVKKAVKALYPEELTEHPAEGMVIQNLFRYFKGRL